jgi:hypothetical protein
LPFSFAACALAAERASPPRRPSAAITSRTISGVGKQFIE